MENGGKKTDIARKFDVPLNTLSTWMKNSDKIKRSFQSGDMNTAKKRLKTCKYEDIDSALLKWFKSKVNEGAMITGPILMSKADKFG